jgi:hypothetical protein
LQRSYIVTEEEIIEVKDLGFNISFGKFPFVDFLKESFQGLHLIDYLKGINDLLTPLTTARIEKEVVYFESPPPTLVIQVYSEDEANDQTGLAFSQGIVKREDEMVAELDFLRIPILARHQGVAKQLLNICLQQYIFLGVDKIVLEAALTNGGLFWAKAFFTARNPKEVEIILADAEERLAPEKFKFVKRVYDNYYNQHPNGTDFPMVKWSEIAGMEEILKGSRWHGELDLNNSEVLSNFKHYVA